MSPTPDAEEIALETEEQKILYAVGQALSRSVANLDFTAEEMAFVSAGLVDGATGVESRVDMTTYGPQLDASMRDRVAGVLEKEGAAGKAYCETQAAEEGAERLASGMIYKLISEGDGPSPAASDRVKVHYHGTLRDGSVFDTTRGGGEPAEFSVGGVIPCFSEGLQKMKVGGKSKVTCPTELAYGERGRPGSIRPGAALTFELELVEVVANPAAPAPAAAEEPIP